MTLPEETEQLLSDLRTLIETFVAWPESHHGAVVAAWVLHAHTIEAFDSTPRLALMSAEKQSGKTRALEVLDLVVPKVCDEVVDVSAISVPHDRQEATDGAPR